MLHKWIALLAVMQEGFYFPTPSSGVSVFKILICDHMILMISSNSKLHFLCFLCEIKLTICLVLLILIAFSYLCSLFLMGSVFSFLLNRLRGVSYSLNFELLLIICAANVFYKAFPCFSFAWWLFLFLWLLMI